MSVSASRSSSVAGRIVAVGIAASRQITAGAGPSVLQESLQPQQSAVPLSGDRFQVPAGLGQAFRLEAPLALPALLRPSDEAGIFHNAQVLRDRLPRHVEALRQL